jgi:hypothetical protein
MIFLFGIKNHCYGRFNEGSVIDRNSFRRWLVCDCANGKAFFPVQGNEARYWQSLRGKEFKNNPPQRRFERSIS